MVTDHSDQAYCSDTHNSSLGSSGIITTWRCKYVNLWTLLSCYVNGALEIKYVNGKTVNVSCRRGFRKI